MRKRRKKGEHKMDDSWLLPYADLLTLLLALFIVLFSMSEMDAQKYEELSRVFKSEFSNGKSILEEGIAPQQTSLPENEDDEEEEEEENEEVESNHMRELRELQELQKGINNYISESNLSNILETSLTDEGLLITILNDVSFDSGKAIVKEKGQEIAKEVAEFLVTDPPHQIVVSGHADDRPMHNKEFASNWELSVTRALNFMALLLRNESLDPTRFSAKGFGEHKPIVPNTSEENMAKNRRVEVLILPNYEIDTQQADN
jgi:chemotaxis protein MotB